MSRPGRWAIARSGLRRAASRLFRGPAPGVVLPDAAAPVAQGGVPRDVLRQVRLIELRTRGWVNTLFGGEYRSVFKGQGMEFAEVREYQPGDDVRNLDWNVTARMGHPYVKKHVEERELTVMLLVDFSGSERFGTRGRLKAEVAGELAAVLALSAIRNNDRVGLIIFTDRVEHVVPPKKGRRHVLRLIRDLLAFHPQGRRTDLADALDYAGRMLPHRSVLFVLSDFQVGGADALDAFRRTLRLVSNRHDVIAVRVLDAAEEALPDAGVLVLTDPETGREVAVDTGRAALRRRYSALSVAEEQALQQTFRRLAVDTIEVRTDRSFVTPLMTFFRSRERKLTR